MASGGPWVAVAVGLEGHGAFAFGVNFENFKRFGRGGKSTFFGNGSSRGVYGVMLAGRPSANQCEARKLHAFAADQSHSTPRPGVHPSDLLCDRFRRRVPVDPGGFAR